MPNNTQARELLAEVIQESNSTDLVLHGSIVKKPYTRPTFHELDDIIEKTKVTDFTEFGQSVCSVNGS